MSDVTDASFRTEVIERSMTVAVVVDLWAQWCGPCKTLSPILEKVIGETGGEVELAKVDVDVNPEIAQAFRVQSIPAVFALKEGKIVDSFVGALGETQVREFVEKLAPGALAKANVLDLEDEVSLHEALARDAGNADAAVALADLLRRGDRLDEAAEVLGSYSSVPAAKTVLARIKLQRDGVSWEGDLDLTLDHLLDRVTTDADAKDNLLLLLDALGPEDPRYVSYRRQIANRLY